MAARHTLELRRRAREMYATDEWSQTALAEELGVSRGVLQYWCFLVRCTRCPWKKQGTTVEVSAALKRHGCRPQQR